MMTAGSAEIAGTSAQKYPAAASLKESEIAGALFVDELARCGFIDHLYAA
jgi:hypothetical protein